MQIEALYAAMTIRADAQCSELAAIAGMGLRMINNEE